jgi:cobyrinic acid a,c-diamide synthase
MAIVIAGERSGSGKTTITLALLAALKARNQAVQSFKVGPDYIDPMFHAYVTNRPCYNLDMVLTSEDHLPQCFNSHINRDDIAVVEGVMGLFDGAAEPSGYGSTAQVAKCLGLPVVLVLNCSSMSQSIAAMVHGYRGLDPDLQIAGVILNRVGSDRHREILEAALQPMNIAILGVFRREDEISLPDRHLGLIPTTELPELDRILAKLATLGETNFNWPALSPLLKPTQTQLKVPLPKGDLGRSSPVKPIVRLAVARDQAFSFYYAENLERLEQLGAELVFWSPLTDPTLPENVQGLYFGGGFPEMFAAQLADNRSARTAVQQAITAGLPTYAECGGLMYLSQAIVDFDGIAHDMVGILPTQTIMGKRLTLGYRSAVAQASTPILAIGDLVRGHEFHRSTVTVASTQPLFKMGRGSNLDATTITTQSDALWEGWHQPTLQASYLHLHWGATPDLPTRWIDMMASVPILAKFR